MHYSIKDVHTDCPYLHLIKFCVLHPFIQSTSYCTGAPITSFSLYTRLQTLSLFALQHRVSSHWTPLASSTADGSKTRGFFFTYCRVARLNRYFKRCVRLITDRSLLRSETKISCFYDKIEVTNTVLPLVFPYVSQIRKTWQLLWNY